MPSFAITSAISTVTTNAAANVVPTGQAATFSTGSIFLWNEIDDSQTPNYSGVATSQTPTYSGVATSQDPNYTSITAGRDAA
jgi:hypothetical protein